LEHREEETAACHYISHSKIGNSPVPNPFVHVELNTPDPDGEVMKDVTEVAGMGWLSFIRDPTGAVLGLWQSKSK
jgi:hypothetical protein